MINQSDINSVKQLSEPVYNLPEKPVVVIEANRISLITDLLKLWHYRDLLLVLTIRDIKVRYKQTVLGILWVVIQPVFMMFFFTLIFSRFAGMPSDGVPYPIFAYAGLLPWTFFSNALNSSSNSLVNNSSLITKVYFPRMIIPIASVGAVLVDFLIAFGLLILLMFYYGIGFSWNILMLPLLAFLTALSAIGVGMWLAALNVKYRDIRYALSFIIQIWMFATPIIYPSTILPEEWRWLFKLNFLTGLIEAYRSAIFGKPFDFIDLSISIFIIMMILVYSVYTFRRMERSFADIV